MSRYSVEIGVPPRVYDIVIRKPNPKAYDRRMIDLARSDGKDVKHLCEVVPSQLGGWTVVVYPPLEEDYLTGPAIVDGFRTINSAWLYASQIRPDINRRNKDRHGE